MDPMSDQETLQPRKRRGPPATGQGTPVQVRLHDDLLLPLDQWIATQPEPPTRPEALRRMVADWLRERGYLKD